MAFAGTRMLRDLLRLEGVGVDRGHVRTPICRWAFTPFTASPTPASLRMDSTYPNLLKGLTVDHANPVWAADTTYLPTRRKVLHLAIVDWHSSASWRGVCPTP
ncbi:MAG TPA: hypothetical protein VFQ88_03715 [Nevskiaceae bacterium]|nr:hypothetical protein [Nevskiaceae bacterium]